MMPFRHLHDDEYSDLTAPQKVGHWLHKWWPWIAVVVVALVLVGRSQQQAEKLNDTVQDVKVLSRNNVALTHQNAGLVHQLHRAIVQACIENGNAARKSQREQLQEELVEAKHPDPAVLRAFNLPPPKLHELIQQNIHHIEVRIARVKPVHCAKRYELSPSDASK